VAKRQRLLERDLERTALERNWSGDRSSGALNRAELTPRPGRGLAPAVAARVLTAVAAAAGIGTIAGLGLVAGAGLCRTKVLAHSRLTAHALAVLDPVPSLHRRAGVGQDHSGTQAAPANWDTVIAFLDRTIGRA
jgi:hypothetical protein